MFCQRNIYISFATTGDISQVAIKRIVRLMLSNQVATACIFVNFMSEAPKLVVVLENQLADIEKRVDVLQIHGDMDK